MKYFGAKNRLAVLSASRFSYVDFNRMRLFGGKNIITNHSPDIVVAIL